MDPEARAEFAKMILSELDRDHDWEVQCARLNQLWVEPPAPPG